MDKQETFPFSIYFLSASFSFISTSNKAGNTVERQKKREKEKPCLYKSAVEVHNQLYAY